MSNGISFMEIEDLAAEITGVCKTACTEDIENQLIDLFEIDLHQFAKIVSALIPFTLTANPALTGEPFKGFVKDGFFICKQKVSND